jgi:hypothetical protein
MRFNEALTVLLFIKLLQKVCGLPHDLLAP